MENGNLEQLARFTGRVEERDFINEIDIETLFDCSDERTLTNKRDLTFAVLGKAESEKIATQK